MLTKEELNRQATILIQLGTSGAIDYETMFGRLRYLDQLDAKRRILETPYPPPGEMFVDWCPVPKTVLNVNFDGPRIRIPRRRACSVMPPSDGYPNPFDPQERDYDDVELKRLNWNDSERGLRHSRSYGWEPETRTLVLGPERVEVCCHRHGMEPNVCPDCGFDHRKAFHCKPYNMIVRLPKDALMDDQFAPITEDELRSDPYLLNQKLLYEAACRNIDYLMAASGLERNDPSLAAGMTRKPDPAACDHTFVQEEGKPEKAQCASCGMYRQSWERGLESCRRRCAHDFNNTTGRCLYCRRRIESVMRVNRPRRGLTWRLRAWWYTKLSRPIQHVKDIAAEFAWSAVMIVRLLILDVASAARFIWRRVPKPIPGRRFRIGDRLTREDRERMFTNNRHWNEE